MTAPDPQTVHGWTAQNSTTISGPVENGQLFTTVNHSVIDETTHSSAGSKQTDQNHG
jgi:hypothetical protein